jgi:hypothetical protein
VFRLDRQLAHDGVTPDDIAAAFSEIPPRPRRRHCEIICDYLDMVERDAPFVPAIIFGGSGLMKMHFLAKTLEAFGKLRQAARGAGESRIEALRVAAAFVLESMYQEMVIVLYEIECVRLSRPITPGLSFGNLVDNVAHSTRDLLPGFIDRNAARIRNAASHDHWQEREFASGVLDLHDTDPTLRSLAVSQVYRRVRDCYRDVQDFAICMQWRTAASFLSLFSRPPMTHALAAVFSGKTQDREVADAVGSVLSATLGAAGACLSAIGWTSRARPDSVATG